MAEWQLEFIDNDILAELLMVSCSAQRILSLCAQVKTHSG